MILHKGEVLFYQGELGPLYDIKSGLFKITRSHPDGSEFLVNIIIPGEKIPHHSLLTHKEYYGTATALIQSEVEIINPEQWYTQLNEHPELYKDTALLLQSKLRMMQQRIDQLTQVKPIDKLIQLQAWFEQFIEPHPWTEILTQEEMGQFIGLRRETVNRLLRKLSEKEV